jgi:ADP-ribose 1''-phosphate phosphatase
VIDAGERPIACLFTSKGYARDTDPPAKILESTKSALDQLSVYFKGRENVEIASPMINAGLFNVPWPETEALIEDFLAKNVNCSWTVYQL